MPPAAEEEESHEKKGYGHDESNCRPRPSPATGRPLEAHAVLALALEVCRKQTYANHADCDIASVICGISGVSGGPLPFSGDAGGRVSSPNLQSAPSRRQLDPAGHRLESPR
jgi:hypothetical protein